MIFLYLFVLGLAIVIFLAVGGRSRRRKAGTSPPQIDVTKKSDLETRAPGED
ncbi:MAG TPA: hypothetical protein VFE22_04525 [Edaphobacter sp.]|jgi:hypothetical protein|nr:hypothetical protein [Edaphobacter sp.]